MDSKVEATVGLNPYHFGGDNPVMFNDPLGDKMQKGEDGNYHPDWYNDLMWGGRAGGTYNGYGSNGGGGGNSGFGGGIGGGQYAAFWTAALGAINSGYSIKKDKNGNWGFWSNYIFDSGIRGNGNGNLDGVGVGVRWNALNNPVMSAYTPTKNWAEKWESFNNSWAGKILDGPGVSRAVYGLADGIWTAGSTLKNGWRDARNMKGEHLINTYGAKAAEGMRLGSAVTFLSLPFGAIGGEAAVAKESISSSSAIMLEEQSVFLVTKEGVALPKGGQIPSEWIGSPFPSPRSSTYGIMQDGTFIQKLRIDPARFAEPSHFHLNNQGNKLTIWRWF